MNDALFIVNVEVAIHCHDEWLVIRRSEFEDHAPGAMSLVGGKVEASYSDNDLLIENLIREVYEELGLKLENEVVYVESSFFQTDRLENVVDVVFMTSIDDKEQEMNVNYSEVSDFSWLTAAQIIDSSTAPKWLKKSIQKAEQLRVKEATI